MGWPKGVPRKGHINKNGQVHEHYRIVSLACSRPNYPSLGGRQRAIIVEDGRRYINISPKSNGHEPDKRWVGRCVRCRSFFRGEPLRKMLRDDE